MKTVVNVLVAILFLLALSSGAAKVILMPQEVEFFGAYGFTPSLLMAFPAGQPTEYRHGD